MILKKTAAVAAACVLALSASLCARAATTQSGNAVEFDSAADFRIAAMYSESGEFVGVQKFSEELGFIDYSKLAQNADGECKVKIFSWDSSSLEPKADMIENKTAVFSTLDLDIETTAQGAASGYSYKEMAAEQIAGYNSIYVTPDNIQSKEYKLSENAKLFVNGVEVRWNTDNLYTYLITSKVGRVTLANTAGTDDSYNIVSVTYYTSAVISDVVGDKIYFDTVEIYMPSYMELDQTKVDDGDLTYTITLDGEQISPSDLRENDVISVAYDVSNDFEDSDFYDIIVSRNIVKGVIEKDDEEKETYTVNGVEYIYDYNYLPGGYDSDAVGLDAILYVDAFGRVVNILENKENIKIAILENVYESSDDGTAYAELILTDGSIAEYALKESDDMYDLMQIVYYDGDSTSDKNDACDRIVRYKLTSANEIYSVQFFRGFDTNWTRDDYNSRANKIGSMAMSESTKILDVSDYIFTGNVNDIYAISPSQLTDGFEYTAYGYNKLYNATYAFVLITEGIGSYNDYTQPAVFVTSTTAPDRNGNDCAAVTLLYNGKERTYILDDGNIDGLNKGDVIVFRSNYYDEITDIEVIASMGLSDGTNRIPCADRNVNVYPYVINVWDPAYNPDTEVELNYGAVTDKANDYVFVSDYGTQDSFKREHGYKLTDNSKVYVYDYTAQSKSALYVSNISDITKTIIPYSARDEYYNVLWDKLGNDTINFALVKAVGGEVDTILFVKAENKNTADPKPDYSSIKTAIAEDVSYDDATETAYVKLILPNASTAEFAADSALSAKLSGIIYTTNDSVETVKKDIYSRVVEYTLDANGKITDIYAVSERAESDKYIAPTNRINSVRLNADTALIDVSKYESGASVSSISELKNGYMYSVHAYGRFADGTYSMILIDSGVDAYVDETQTAVFVKAYKDIDENGNECDAVTVLYDGAEQSFILAGGVTAENINRGDVVVFALDGQKIIRMNTVGSMQLCSAADRIPYEDRDAVEPVLPTEWNMNTAPNTRVELTYGRIVDKTSLDFTLVPADKEFTSDNDEMYFDLTSDTKVYVYSYKNPNKSALYVGTVSDIIKTSIPKAAQDADTDDIDWTHSALEWSTNYAFVKSIDSEAAEVFVIIAPGKANY